MAPKRNARDAATTAAAAAPVKAAAPAPVVKPKKDANLSPQEVAVAMWDGYVKTTPQRTKLIDVFMAFLAVVGVLQFVYCVIVGNYVSAATETRRGVCELGE